jgi:hypothetical protein
MPDFKLEADAVSYGKLRQKNNRQFGLTFFIFSGITEFGPVEMKISMFHGSAGQLI